MAVAPNPNMYEFLHTIATKPVILTHLDPNPLAMTVARKNLAFLKRLGLTVLSAVQSPQHMTWIGGDGNEDM